MAFGYVFLGEAPEGSLRGVSRQPDAEAAAGPCGSRKGWFVVKLELTARISRG